ncbi:MAG: hypothetical protein MJ229_06365 [bacterium]|nr:hypothetical protein [bacterium]
MSQQIPNPPRTRTTLVIFLKGAATPVALFVENPVADYNELQQLLKVPTPKIYEKEGQGPIKKLSVPVNQILAVALQDVPMQ